MFKKMLSEVNHEIANFIFKGNIPIRSSEEVKQAQAQRTNLSHMKESREDAVSRGPGAVRTSGGEQQKPLEPVRVEKKVGRNDACPCGSGKKYKNCHGKDE
ncbi:MAG: SEC-C domain-containing protein [Chitinophagales bacterium]|nr:SEC-C domain-containing protein [Chitinophagales bacterium]